MAHLVLAPTWQHACPACLGQALLVVDVFTHSSLTVATLGLARGVPMLASNATPAHTCLACLTVRPAPHFYRPCACRTPRSTTSLARPSWAAAAAAAEGIVCF